MNELNDLHDDDLRQLLPTVDHIEPAPPELVERLWHELQPLLDDDATGKVATLRPQRQPATAGRHQWTMFAAAAAVVAVFAGGIVLLTSQRGPVEREPGVADLPSASTTLPEDAATTPPGSTAPTTVPAPATVAAACEVFRRTVAEPVPFDSLEESGFGDVEQLTTWVDGLGTLLADIDRVGRPADSADQYLSIQLLRTAFRTAIDDVGADDDSDLLTALANARRHFDTSQQGESELATCLSGA